MAKLRSGRAVRVVPSGGYAGSGVVGLTTATSSGSSRPLTNSMAAGGVSSSNTSADRRRARCTLSGDVSPITSNVCSSDDIESFADGLVDVAAKRLGSDVEPVQPQRHVAQVEQVAMSRCRPRSSSRTSIADVDRQVPRQARGSREQRRRGRMTTARHRSPCARRAAPPLRAARLGARRLRADRAPSTDLASAVQRRQSAARATLLGLPTTSS